MTVDILFVQNINSFVRFGQVIYIRKQFFVPCVVFLRKKKPFPLIIILDLSTYIAQL